jgi:thiol-disulfide isomerase/thioredoxin
MKTSVYVVIALVAAAAGFGIYHFGVAPKAREERINAAEAAQVQGEPAAESTPAVPDVLPDFTLSGIDGQPRSIRSWQGKSMIVNFWATWCAPCRREIPLLKKIQAEHGAEGFQIVGVAVDFREDVLKYAKDIGIDYPLLIGEQDGLDAVNKFGQARWDFRSRCSPTTSSAS